MARESYWLVARGVYLDTHVIKSDQRDIKILIAERVRRPWKINPAFRFNLPLDGYGGSLRAGKKS